MTSISVSIIIVYTLSVVGIFSVPQWSFDYCWRSSRSV